VSDQVVEQRPHELLLVDIGSSCTQRLENVFKYFEGLLHELHVIAHGVVPEIEQFLFETCTTFRSQITKRRC